MHKKKFLSFIFKNNFWNQRFPILVKLKNVHQKVYTVGIKKNDPIFVSKLQVNYNSPKKIYIHFFKYLVKIHNFS